MCPPTKVNGVWPFNDAWLRTSLEEARRQAPRNVASILDSARELGIRDAQVGLATRAMSGRPASNQTSLGLFVAPYAHRWTANLRILEIDEIKTVPHVPRSHPFVERLIGTTRREFLDPVLFWHARDLERTLGDFQAYYNEVRSHASLKGHTPLTFAGGHTVARAELNNVRWISHCRDLVQLPVAA